MGRALEHVAGSGRIEANLEVAGREVQPLGGGAAQIAPGFQQPEGQVLGGADPLRKGLTQQAALRHQLTEQMGDLQQEVKDFGGRGVLSVSVFQRVAPCF